MRRPAMSTGAWIFTGLLTAAIVAPVGVYAATAAKVRIVSADGTTDARVTPQHQLLTTQISPKQVIRVASGSFSGCKAIYKPPAKRAIVVTSVVYTVGSGTDGVEYFGGLGTANCAQIYDQIDGVQKFDTIQHTFPTGLPLSSVSLSNNGAGLINVFLVGYLIDAASLPPAATSTVGHGAIKGLRQAR